ncbi:hypothetical protein FRC18_008221 [Serendipita sp. 400]|nr:hypothetical protein FRC18_008221 [Serendipita sp. 400]
MDDRKATTTAAITTKATTEVVGPIVTRALERRDLSSSSSHLVPIGSLQPGVLDYLISWRTSHISAVKSTFLNRNDKTSNTPASRLPRQLKEYIENIPDKPDWKKTGYVDTKELPPFVRYLTEKRSEDGKEVVLIPVGDDWKEKEVKLEEVDLEFAKQVLGRHEENWKRNVQSSEIEAKLARGRPHPGYFSRAMSKVGETLGIGTWLERPKDYYSHFHIDPLVRALGDHIRTEHRTEFPTPERYTATNDQGELIHKPRRELTSEERDEVMKRFREGQLHVVKSFRATPAGAAMAGGMAGLTLGFVGSALQNAVQRHNHGWKGVFTRTGSTIWGFALAGGLYGFTDAYLKEKRGKDDAWGKFAAGCTAGFMLGMRGKSIPTALGSCVFLGTPVAVLQLQGGSLRGDGQYEHMSLPSQQTQTLRGMFRHPQESKTEAEHGHGHEEEHGHGHGSAKVKVMSPSLRQVLTGQGRE